MVVASRQTSRVRVSCSAKHGHGDRTQPILGIRDDGHLAKSSVETGRPIRELVLERGLLDKDRLDAILSPEAMTRGGIVGGDEASKATETSDARPPASPRRTGRS